MKTTKEQRSAWKRYFGEPAVDDYGEQYIPEVPPVYIRGWKDGQIAIINSCDFRHKRSYDEKTRRVCDQIHDLLEQWGERAVRCEDMIISEAAPEAKLRLKTKQGVIVSMKMEVERILKQNF